MKQAVLSIQVDDKNNLEVRFQGEPALELSMIGALKFAEKYLVDRINARSAVSATETCKNSENLYNAENEKIVSKDDAIGIYLDAWSKIESRIQAINKAPKQATFAVNESLLSNL